MSDSNDIKEMLYYKFKSIISFSHLFGCITTTSVNFIRAAFNKDFFQTIKVTTEVPYEERKKFAKNLINKPRPMFIIAPKVNLSDDTEWMPSTEFDQLGPNDTSGNKWFIPNTAISIIDDNANKYDLVASRRRYKVEFDMIFKFNSEMQKLQAQEYIRQNIRHNSVMVVERHLEFNIPDQFMRAIAYIEKMDINSIEFISHMNKISNVPITHRVRPGSGNKEFFSLIPTKLHIKLNSLPSDNGNDKKGNMITGSSFSENMVVEFTAMSTFYLRTPVKIPPEIPMSDTQMLYQTVIKPVDSSVTDVEMDMVMFEEWEFSQYNNTLMKKSLQLKAQFDNDDDSLDISNYTAGMFRIVYDYHKTNKIPINFLKVNVARGLDILPDNLYTFDNETLSLKVSNVDKYSIYTVVMYVDQEYINKIVQSINSMDRAYS